MRIHKDITILEAHDKWLKERKIKLSRFVQRKINDEIKKELIEKEIR